MASVALNDSRRVKKGDLDPNQTRIAALLQAALLPRPKLFSKCMRRPIKQLEFGRKCDNARAIVPIATGTPNFTNGYPH
jgi:hypothetical protein